MSFPRNNWKSLEENNQPQVHNWWPRITHDRCEQKANWMSHLIACSYPHHLLTLHYSFVNSSDLFLRYLQPGDLEIPTTYFKWNAWWCPEHENSYVTEGFANPSLFLRVTNKEVSADLHRYDSIYKEQGVGESNLNWNLIMSLSLGVHFKESLKVSEYLQDEIQRGSHEEERWNTGCSTSSSFSELEIFTILFYFILFQDSLIYLKVRIRERERETLIRWSTDWLIWS